MHLWPSELIGKHVMVPKNASVACCETIMSVAAESETAGSKFYVLRSLVPRNWKKKFMVDDSESPSRHLLMVLLMLIKCHGDKLAEGVKSILCMTSLGAIIRFAHACLMLSCTRLNKQQTIQAGASSMCNPTGTCSPEACNEAVSACAVFAC